MKEEKVDIKQSEFIGSYLGNVIEQDIHPRGDQLPDAGWCNKHGWFTICINNARPNPDCPQASVIYSCPRCDCEKK